MLLHKLSLKRNRAFHAGISAGIWSIGKVLFLTITFRSCTRGIEVSFHYVVKSVAPVRKINRTFCCGPGIAFMKVNFDDGEV